MLKRPVISTGFLFIPFNSVPKTKWDSEKRENVFKKCNKKKPIDRELVIERERTERERQTEINRGYESVLCVCVSVCLLVCVRYGLRQRHAF